MHFQEAVRPWVKLCFGVTIANDGRERNLRFIEESLELVQSLNLTEEEVLRVVKYVYSRPSGQPSQEVGGVMVTLAALCCAYAYDMRAYGYAELTRCFDNIEKIRGKNLTKPSFREE